jgi:hypothetical protein
MERSSAGWLASGGIAVTDPRIAIIRATLLRQHALHMADCEIRSLLLAIDAVGKPLPAGQTISLGELTQKPVTPDEAFRDLIADARAHDEAHQPAFRGQA